MMFGLNDEILYFCLFKNMYEYSIKIRMIITMIKNKKNRLEQGGLLKCNSEHGLITRQQMTLSIVNVLKPQIIFGR
jgi:hypothetical protein